MKKEIANGKLYSKYDDGDANPYTCRQLEMIKSKNYPYLREIEKLGHYKLRKSEKETRNK